MAKYDMKKNVGLTSPRNKSDVTGSDAGLASSGMLGKGVNRNSSTDRFSHNQWSGHSNDGRGVDFGMGPTRGNQSDSTRYDTAHPATFDKLQKTIATASQGHNVGKGFTQLHFGNPDKINVGNN